MRDNNEAFGTQVLEVLEFMSDATTSQMLVDGDTGYVNDEAVSVRGIRRDLNVQGE